MKKILSTLLIIIMIISISIPVFAEQATEKEEIVYGILNDNGSVNNIYVVNIFSSPENNTIFDYGNYTSIRNMTTTDLINKNEDLITINTDAERLYYEGKLSSTELPWNINIKYYIDDVEYSSKDIAGKSGKLKIETSITQNTNINKIFFENYALQSTFLLDNKNCKNIIADGATIAEVGSKKQLTYTILPGKETEFVITADVNNFEMDAITINGIKMALNIEIDTSELFDKINELIDATEKLDNGALELLNGANELLNGLKTYTDGLSNFNNNISSLTNGANKLNTGATSLRDGINNLTKQNDTLVKGASNIQDNIFSTANEQINSKLNALVLGQLKSQKILPLTVDNYTNSINFLINANPESELVLKPLKVQLDNICQFVTGVKNYTNGVSSLSAGANELVNGSTQLKTASSDISNASAQLYKGANELNTAVVKLRDGINEYKSNTNKFHEKTSTMNTEIETKIDELISGIAGTNEELISFVSGKNNVKSVQFVTKTTAIEIEKPEVIVTPPPVKLTLWEKVLKIFGLYK